MNTYTVEPAKPFDVGEMWGPNKYNLQNMLVRQVRFPHKFHEGDWMNRAWSDRQYNDWDAGAKEMAKKYPDGNYLHWMQDSSDEDFLAFCRKFTDGPITGARLVRYTNVASGYEVYAIDLFRKGDKTPDIPLYSGDHAPNVLAGRRFVISVDGSWEDEM